MNGQFDWTIKYQTGAAQERNDIRNLFRNAIRDGEAVKQFKSTDAYSVVREFCADRSERQKQRIYDALNGANQKLTNPAMIRDEVFQASLAMKAADDFLSFLEGTVEMADSAREQMNEFDRIDSSMPEES